MAPYSFLMENLSYYKYGDPSINYYIGTSDTITYHLQLPKGVTLTNLNDVIFYFANGSANVPAGVIALPKENDVTSNTVKIKFTFTNNTSFYNNFEGASAAFNGLMVSCGNQTGADGGFKFHFSEKQFNCGQEWSYACADLATKVLCNPCTTDGFNVNFTSLNRINFGLPDNNNDGIPDASGNINTTKIRRDRLMHGDTMKLAVAGTIINTNASNVFTYVNFKDKIKVDHTNHNMTLNGVKPIMLEVKLYRGSNVYNTSINNLVVNPADSSITSSIPSSAFGLARFQHGDSIYANTMFRLIQNPSLPTV